MHTNKAKRRYAAMMQSRDTNESEYTPFRLAEKKFKMKWPKPDVSEVIDLATAFTHRQNEVEKSGWAGCSGSLRRIPLNTRPGSPRGSSGAYTLSEVPGLIILPEFLDQQDQRDMIRWALNDHAKHPNQTNLDVHYILPESGLWNAHLQSRCGTSKVDLIRPRSSDEAESPPQYGSRELISNVAASKENYADLASIPKPLPLPSQNAKPTTPTSLVPKLRWANIGWYYHWGIKQYDFSRGKEAVDATLQDVCTEAIRAIDWSQVMDLNDKSLWGETDPTLFPTSYEPDAGIVNYYQTKDTLMAHVDRSEVCESSPLVSISLGSACIFLIGGSTRDEKPTSILLRSGDVVIMAGPCRRAYHGVPRILEGTLPDHLNVESDPSWTQPYKEYMQTSRINVNLVNSSHTVGRVNNDGFRPTAMSSCISCSNSVVWDDALCSAVCTECGTLQNAAQTVLESHLTSAGDDWTGGSSINQLWSTGVGPKSLKGRHDIPLDGQSAEARLRRNMVRMTAFIKNVSSRIGHATVADRAVILFSQVMSSGARRWGKAARLLAASTIAIALSESKTLTALNDIAYVIGEPIKALKSSLREAVDVLGITLPETSVAMHLPTLESALCSFLAEPNLMTAALRRSLSGINLPNVITTAESLSLILERNGVNTGSMAHTSVAVFILALEGEIRKPLPDLQKLAHLLGSRLSIAKFGVMERYSPISDHIAELTHTVPWLKTEGPRRNVVAQGLQDIVTTQSEDWRIRLQADGPLNLDWEEDIKYEETCAEPPYKRRKTNLSVKKAASFLLHPADPDRPKGTRTETKLLSYLLDSCEEPIPLLPPTRTQLLLSQYREPEIPDDLLFAEGELEGFLRTPDEVAIQAQLLDAICGPFEDATSQPRITVKSRSKRGMERIDMDALTRLLTQGVDDDNDDDDVQLELIGDEFVATMFDHSTL